MKGDDQSGLVPSAYVESVSFCQIATFVFGSAPAHAVGFCYVSLHVPLTFTSTLMLPRSQCQAENSSIVKVQYDYDATAEGELSVKEDQLLLVFGPEEDGWLLVQDKDGGKVGYVPGNYIEVSSFLSPLTVVDCERRLN